MTYVVIENAGYEGEQEITEFARFGQAYDYVHKAYAVDELETLHVEIAKRLPDGSLTYEY